jgi:hypothetical protein
LTALRVGGAHFTTTLRGGQPLHPICSFPSLRGEAVGQRLPGAADLELVEVGKDVLGQLEARVGGGLGGDGRGLGLEVAAIELVGEVAARVLREREPNWSACARVPEA